jgi:hypothetical protein
MANISSFTGKFRLQSDADRIVKRPRATLTCAPCRQAKLRCDKGQPCSSCVKRGETARCAYGARNGDPPAERQNVAEQKLAHLESMVLQLMQDQKNQLPTPPDLSGSKPAFPHGGAGDIPGIGSPVGIHNGYAGSTHWSTMLDDIQDLRQLLDNGSADPEHDELASSQPKEVIYGIPEMYSLDQIISDYLPSRAEVERLTAVYFSGETFILPILHQAQFQRQCEDFWTAPLAVKPLWLSLLFSLCYMAAKISSSSGAPILATNPAALQSAAGQCLVLGQYNVAQRYAPEALLFYAQSKNFHSLDPAPEVGAILVMSVRHGYSMGYHRDPDVVGPFSPFEAEMRRRFWATCKQFDLMISFQLGLPSNIRMDLCDAKAPRNLLDSDFDEDSAMLPAPRPETEATRFLWFIVKDGQMPTFSKVCENALSSRKTAYENVELLDREVRNMHAKVPPVLRTRSFADSAADSPFLIMTRLYIDMIYQKSLCVLHRSYMLDQHKQSLMAGSEAANALVTKLVDMYEEQQPGGQLQTHKWMINCFTINDFLLGVTTACLAVHTIRQDVGATAEEMEREQQLLQTLRRASKMCEDVAHASKDAQRVSHAIRLILDGLGSRHDRFASHPTDQLPPSFSMAELNVPLLTPTSGGILGQFDPFDFINNPIQDAEWAAVSSDYGMATSDGPWMSTSQQHG